MNRPLLLLLVIVAGIGGVGTCRQGHAMEIRGYADKCLDVRAASTNNGTVVQMWDCANVPNQQWTLAGGKIVGFGSKCLDVRGPSTNNGTPVQMWDCVNVPNQKWYRK